MTWKVYCLLYLVPYGVSVSAFLVSVLSPNPFEVFISLTGDIALVLGLSIDDYAPVDPAD